MIKKIINFYLKLIWLNSAYKNNRTLISLVEPAKSAKVLEIGIYNADFIIKRVKNIKQPDIYGIDIDSKVIISSKKAGIKAIKHNVEEGIPFKSNFFDIVSANQIIEHLVDIDLFVSEVYRVLKPKGYLLISTENLSSWHNIFALIMGWQAFSQHMSKKRNIGNPMRLSKMEGYDHEGMHVKIFTLRGLKELVQLYKFKVENIYGAGYYPFPPLISDLLSKLDSTHSSFIGLKVRKIK